MMSYKLFDRVMETSTTTGTGTLTLAGARPGYQSFGSRLSNSDTCTFCITDGVDFEVVEGVYSSNTLTRVTVKSSSNSDAKVSWSAGSKEVFLVAPAADLINAKGTNAFTADQSMGSNKLTNLAAPVSASDAPRYFELLNNPSKKRVRVVCDSNVTLSSIQAGSVVDGITLSAGNDVLFVGQTSGSQNGIYTIQSGSAPVRRNDFDSTITAEGSLIPVREGTYADTLWMCSSNGAVIGTDALTFNLISYSSILAGAGLVRNGNAIDVVGTTNRITVAANSIDISSSYVGQTSITTLGTIGTGTWNGTNIAVAYGGTGTTDGSITGTGSLTFTSTGSSSTITLVPGSSTGYVSINGTLKTKGTYRDINSLTYASTTNIDWSLTNFHKITLAGNPTFTFSNDKDGAAIHLAIKQPGSGGNNTVTWPSGINWVEGSAPTLATTNNKIDEVIIRRRGSGDYVGYLLTPSGGF